MVTTRDFIRSLISIAASSTLLSACGSSQMSAERLAVTPTGAAPYRAQGARAQTRTSSDIKYVSRPSATRSYEIIYSFQGSSDAELPYSQDAPLLISNGLLYGTGAGGNAGPGCGVNCGTAFEVSPTGSESVLYRFKGKPDAGNPFGPLISFEGAMYGVAASGGSSGNGAIFALDSSGNEHVVYSFKGGTDGILPEGPLTAFNGALYGTTMEGGKNGLGTVFALTPSGEERVLHSFRYRADGAHPSAGVTALGGKFYGTTTGGGTYAVGTVFVVSTSGKERVIYSFAYGTDGAVPAAPLTATRGKLYGTTTDGGGQNYMGTIFEVTPSGTERVLHRFLKSLTDGQSPSSVLVFQNDKFYGTTLLGGKRGVGTIFAATTSGTERLLHSFSGVPDGRYPTGGLAGLNGVLYGTTNEGGMGTCPYGDGCGTVFALQP